MVSDADYRTLAEFRYLIRHFLEFSHNAAKAVGLQPRHHQALLAIKGSAWGRPITVGDLAEHLRIRPNSAAGLVDRLVEAGLVVRQSNKGDHRRVFLNLTALADTHLAELSAVHLDELSRIEPMLIAVVARQKNNTQSVGGDGG